jgi:hypothetical protein
MHEAPMHEAQLLARSRAAIAVYNSEAPLAVMWTLYMNDYTEECMQGSLGVSCEQFMLLHSH